MRGGRVPAIGVGLALAAVLLVGCGGGDKGQASPTTVPTETTVAGPVETGRPCDLVTKAEVEAAVGETVTPGTAVDSPTGAGCSFTFASGAKGAIVVVKSGDPANYDTLRKAATNAKDLPGVGDKAYVATGQAVAVKGNDVFVVLFLGVERTGAAQADALGKVVRAAVS